jgi:hypothetical protein
MTTQPTLFGYPIARTRQPELFGPLTATTGLSCDCGGRLLDTGSFYACERCGGKLIDPTIDDLERGSGRWFDEDEGE